MTLAVSPAMKPEAARAHAADDLRLTRPLTLPSLDRRHEFLSEWLPERSSILRTWITHFLRTSVPYRVHMRDGRAMLYVHKILPPVNAKGHPRWCCTE